MLIQNDPAFQEMDEAAYDMMVEYGNARELLGIKKFHGKDGIDKSGLKDEAAAIYTRLQN